MRIISDNEPGARSVKEVKELVTHFGHNVMNVDKENCIF